MMKPEVVADVFYSKLFTEMPSMQKLFPAPIEEHRSNVFNVFNTIIGRLNNIQEINDILEVVLARQKAVGVTTSHLQHVKAALMWTLQHGLGNDWSTEVQDAWQSCYSAITSRVTGSAEFK